jgi:hypothetical protein
MRAWTTSCLFLIAAACAQSLDGLESDAGSLGVDGATSVVDAPLSMGPDAAAIDAPVDAPVVLDAAILHEFNQPCSDRSECKDGICILAPTGGYCSRRCGRATPCPEDFGCYGVTGVFGEPGQVTDVCVKDTNVLCTPCATSTECNPIAPDLCLPSPGGGSFCARDCTTVGCPDGYDCADVQTPAGVARQCLPTSRACDCREQHQGDTKACTLTTPLGGTCAGLLTCGASGWSQCEPPSALDVPDGDFADENCDGIDGDASTGVFVATAANGGEDNDTCGPSHLNPCATITNGTRRARLLGRKFVFVQAGTYRETVIMRDGVSVFGGYDATWKRAPRSGVGHEVRILGQLYAVDDQFVTVVAHDLTLPTTIADVNIVGGNAVGSSNGSGRSSYGVHAAAANLRIERVTINAGTGADGAHGTKGLDAPIVYVTPEMDGKKGQDGEGGVDACSSSTRAGGAAGTNECQSYTTGNPLAGKGGRGGPKDPSCPCAFGGCTAPPGQPGDPAAVWLAEVHGFGGGGGSGGGSCGPAGEGGPGRIVNGAGGAGGKARGRILNRYWYAFPGARGGMGQHGTGGGGGGGAGGCDTGIDTRGAGGGGGGAGGCAAREGGAPGEGGGGSFGIFASDGSVLTVRNVTIEQANAGHAGNGGIGGQGQSGGAGLSGGARGDDDSSPGGKGGDGAHGGHGGGGGGGAGGVSYGIYRHASTVDLDEASIINDNGVRGGNAGQGGASAPMAPLPERDGKAGLPGVPGTTGKSYLCSNPASC